MRIRNDSENKVFYATANSAGFDICSTEEGILDPGDYRVFKTGLFLVTGVPIAHNIALTASPVTPDRVYALEELQIRPRSGLAAKNGVTVLNAPGTVDADYPNEIGVILINLGKEPFYVNKGDRIAQGVVALVLRAENVEVKPDTRAGGFGSTGVKA